MKLKQTVSKIISFDVERLGWDEAFKRSQESGKFDNSHAFEIIKEICKQVDPYILDHVVKTTSVNEQVPVYNPLSHDVRILFDVMGTGSPITFTIRSRELQKFDPKVAAHIKKHLINEILQSRGVNYPTGSDIEVVDREVSVEL